MKKTMQAMAAVAERGCEQSPRLFPRAVLATVLILLVPFPVLAASIEFSIDDSDPFRCEIQYTLADRDLIYRGRPLSRVKIAYHWSPDPGHTTDYLVPVAATKQPVSIECPRFDYYQAYRVHLFAYDSNGRRLPWTSEFSTNRMDSYRSPKPRCGHVAIVPSMPKALSGGEDAADHWIRISNPGAASITVTVDGRDRAGTKAGTYRRELPAYRSVRVNMRAIETAFNVTDPEGWWTLTVAGSGPLYAAATMRQGGLRWFVPVERPATCDTGAVTRAGE